MIPQQDILDYIFQLESEEVAPKTKTFKMDTKHRRIQGFIDGKKSLMQRIYRELKTEKHEFPVYEEFGIKTNDLFGKSTSYAYGTLVNRIKECNFASDYEVESLTNFRRVARKERNELQIEFTVISIYGELNIKEVFSLVDVW